MEWFIVCLSTSPITTVLPSSDQILSFDARPLFDVDVVVVVQAETCVASLFYTLSFLVCFFCLFGLDSVAKNVGRTLNAIFYVVSALRNQVINHAGSGFEWD